MSSTTQVPGSVGWMDLTVADAVNTRDFYAAVAGWTPSAVSMGDYEDFTMLRPDGEAAGGICHARGPNAGIPPHWLIYIVVEDLDARLAAVEPMGGSILVPARSMGAQGRFAIVQDPSGAAVALWSTTPAA